MTFRRHGHTLSIQIWSHRPITHTHTHKVLTCLKKFGNEYWPDLLTLQTPSAVVSQSYHRVYLPFASPVRKAWHLDTIQGQSFAFLVSPSQQVSVNSLHLFQFVSFPAVYWKEVQGKPEFFHFQFLLPWLRRHLQELMVLQQPAKNFSICQLADEQNKHIGQDLYKTPNIILHFLPDPLAHNLLCCCQEHVGMLNRNWP